MAHFGQDVMLTRTTSAPHIACVGLRGIQQVRRARSSARITGRTHAKVQAAKEYGKRNQAKCVDVALLTKNVKDLPTKLARTKKVPPQEFALSLSGCSALLATASIPETHAALSMLSAKDKAKLGRIFSALETPKELGTKSLGAHIASGIAPSLETPKIVASPATLTEMAALLSSASDADTEAALANFSADVMAKLMGALGNEEEVGEKVNTLPEMVTLLGSADAADIEVALASFTQGVMAKLTEALGESETKETTLTEMAALLGSANADDTAAALANCSAVAMAKLTEAVDEAKLETKATTVSEMVALLSSANAADTEAALANCSAGAMAKLTQAVDETKVAVKAATLTEMAALLGAANYAETETALASFSTDALAKLTEAIGSEGNFGATVYTLAEVVTVLASASVAETEAAIASFNPDIKAKLTDALKPPGDFRSMPRSGWGDIHALFPSREVAGSRSARVEQTSPSPNEIEVSHCADERPGDVEMKIEK